MGAKKKATQKKYLAMYSSCGGADQLVSLDDRGGVGEHTTVEGARKAVADDLEYQGNDGGTYVIAEIIDVGQPSGMQWTGKNHL